MRTATIILFAVLLSACSAEREPQAEAKTEAAAETKRPGQVVLDAQAQGNAGIAVEPVRSETVRETIHSTGELTVNEDQTWSVGALHDGRITAVLVKIGDTVREGRVLARMHSHEVHDSRAEHKQAVSDLARAQGEAAQAQRMYDRAKRLLELKAMSQQEVEIAAAELNRAQTSVQHAKAELEKVRVHLTEFLDVPIEDSPGEEDDMIPIKAPAAGTVVDRKITQGSVISTGQEVFRITTASSVWMLANVNEADLSNLRVGQPVRVLVRAYPDRAFKGQILRLGEQLDPTTRTLKVRVLVPNPGGMLKPEMYATAEIEREEAREAMFIPDAAVQDLSGNRVVFIRTSADRFEARPIQIGRSVEGRSEVLAGLHPGDQVVVKGSFVLKSQLLRSSIEEE